MRTEADAREAARRSKDGAEGPAGQLLVSVAASTPPPPPLPQHLGHPAPIKHLRMMANEGLKAGDVSAVNARCS